MQLYQVIKWCESYWEDYKGMFYFKCSIYENLTTSLRMATHLMKYYFLNNHFV